MSVDINGWQANGADLDVGSEWPDRTATHFESSKVAIPADWPLRDTFLELDLGGESLITLEYSNQEREVFGHDRHHRRFYLKDSRFKVFADAVPRSLFGCPVTNPKLNVARLILVERHLESLVERLRLLESVVRSQIDHEAADPLVSAAEDALSAVELPSETQAYLTRYPERQYRDDILHLPMFTWSNAG